MNSPRKELSADRLRSLFDYNPQTGKFYFGHGHRFGCDAGGSQSRGYIKITVDGADYLAHRLAWLYVHGEWPINVIDHINGNKTDNRIENLRDVTQLENVRAYRARIVNREAMA